MTSRHEQKRDAWNPVMRRAIWAAAMLWTLFSVATVQAAPITINDFSRSEEIIDFDALVGDILANQFAAQGVVFNPNLVFALAPGLHDADSAPNLVVNDINPFFELTFSVPVNRGGLWFSHLFLPQGVTLTVFDAQNQVIESISALEHRTV